MRDHLYIFFFMIQFSTGCILSDERQTIEITGYTGGSVVLPCSCAHPQSTANTFTWLFHGNGKQWIPVFEDEEYSGRRVLFNERSPQNLSLLISGLRKEDEGYYECKTEQYRSIHLTVKGCNLVQNTEATNAVTGYAGESVVLPCSCSELLAKPEQIRWRYYVENTFKEIYPNEKVKRHKNRVKLLNQTSPGNLSLHISALTAEDEGDYQCSVSSQTVSYRLHVEAAFSSVSNTVCMNVQRVSSPYCLTSNHDDSDKRNIKDGDVHKTEKYYHFSHDTRLTELQVHPSKLN
ncbi:Polymeric immunoglobulin receptor [Anabarilius grahami]|nr:Polymeric immunoglobulin receptor [Anabarilius grahami]